MPIEGPPFDVPVPIPVGVSQPKTFIREISVPFSFDRGGRVAVVSDPDAQVRQKVNALLRTNPGERVMRPTYGVSMLQYVFENISRADLAAMQQDISDGFDDWIPSARLVRLNGINGPDQGVPIDTVILSLEYQRRFDATNTVTTANIPVVRI